MINRREALRTIGLGAAAGTVLTTGAAVAVAAHVNAHPDAELIALGRELEEAWENEKAVYAAWEGICTHDSDAICEEANKASSAIVDRIEACRARTLEGVRVKALAVSWCVCGEPFEDDTFSDQKTTDVRLASAVLRDLLAMKGGA